MKKIFIAALAFTALNAYSQNLNTADFGVLNLKNSDMEIPLTSYVKTDSLEYSMNINSNVHFLAQTGKSVLFAFIDKEEQYKEFYAFWSKILSENDFKIVSSEYKDGFAKINYESDKGLVIRNFWADKMDYDAKNEVEISKLKNELVSALSQKGMKTVSVMRVNNDAFRPTFVLYYIARSASAPEKEKILRQLKKGEDIDFELLADKVDFVKKDSSFSLVYIGKELGFVSKLATDETAALKKIEEYKKFLSENKKEFIASKIKLMDEPFVSGENTFNYLVNIYFFQ
ncbi:MAG: hypothetical protein AB1637_02295 [Elusimicrobiota bacterium]